MFFASRFFGAQFFAAPFWEHPTGSPPPPSGSTYLIFAGPIPGYVLPAFVV